MAELRSENIPLQSGVVQPGFKLELLAQRIPIRGVVVDNANSSVPCYVYGGTSPVGTPYIVQAGWSRGFTVAGTAAIWIAFPFTPTADGSVYISVSSDPQVAFSTQVFTGNVTFISEYPANSKPFQGSVQTQPINSGITLVNLGPIGLNHIIYMSHIWVKGCSDQRVQWLASVGGATAFFTYYYRGDVDTSFTPALLLGTSNTLLGVASIQINSLPNPTYTPVNVDAGIQGYWI